jgi:acyl carrier protein
VEDRRSEPVLSALRAALRRQPPPGIDPDLLYDLGEREGYAVRVTYTRDDATCCDAVFSRDGVIWPRAAPPPSVADWQHFANDPLWRDQARRAGQALRQRLALWLPAPMLPSVVVTLEQIPVTSNGKLDRAALLELVGERRAARGARPPQTPTEHALAAIWEEYLRRDRLSADDDFFDLGGHSLLATQIVGRIRARFAIELPVRAIFETPALHALAARIDALRWVAAPPERVREPREEGVI